MLEYGTKVYKYKGYIHAKTMIIDDEVCGVFYENQLVQRYNKIYDYDILECDSYTWDVFRGRDRKERILESIFLPFAPLM
ncbi:MAG: hypothetical protein KHZ01_06850 [Lachnospiraceae bacterium]|nr:hypothetical protein [Lachnospiraceae bacterium]